MDRRQTGSVPVPACAAVLLLPALWEAHVDGYGRAAAVLDALSGDNGRCAQTRDLLAGADKRGLQTLVLLGEEFDLGLKLREPCLFALAAFECG